MRTLALALLVACNAPGSHADHQGAAGGVDTAASTCVRSDAALDVALEGWVLDDDGAPIAGAYVALLVDGVEAASATSTVAYRWRLDASVDPVDGCLPAIEVLARYDGCVPAKEEVLDVVPLLVEHAGRYADVTLSGPCDR